MFKYYIMVFWIENYYIMNSPNFTINEITESNVQYLFGKKKLIWKKALDGTEWQNVDIISNYYFRVELVKWKSYS